MPELPEVETIKRGLQRNIVGKSIKAVDISLPKMVSLGPKTVSNTRLANRKKVENFKELLRNQKVARVRRRAKMLIFDLTGDLTLLIHLKMTGQLIFAKSGERKKVKTMNIENSSALELPHKYTHVIFEFTDGSRLFFNDLRQFGYVKLVYREELPKVPELAAYGPEPFSRAFTLEYLTGKAKRRPEATIKQFLTDPNVIAGIGNIYSDEILYSARIRPKRRLRSLNPLDWKAIYTSIPRLLRKAVSAQGSSVGDFFKVDGSEGKYGFKHMVYGRGGLECKKCTSIIKTVKLGGRTSSYCPKCQR